MDLIQFDGVGKVFDGGVSAIANLTLHIPEGDFVSLIGPSGCGKSTILKLIAGLEAPSSGKLFLGWSSQGYQGELSYVLQDSTLMPWATVFENVWLPLRLKGVKRHQAVERVHQALDAVGLREFAQARPNELSGGMKMRVSLARAAVTRPKVLLLDEPFAALDEPSRQVMADDLLKLWSQSGVTVIMVTHNIAEAVYLSQRVVIVSPRPATVLEDVEISFKGARQPNLRLEPEFLGITAHLSRRLSEVASEPFGASV